MITLGHNSSVIYYDGLTKPVGYEEERLTGKKSDSSYPKLALERVISEIPKEDLRGCTVFISHWFDKFEVIDFPERYFDHCHFDSFIRDNEMRVIPLSKAFTHHDAHAWSTLAFSENFGADFGEDVHHMVIDGFGNESEVISIYKGTDLKPVQKVYGFGNSLGLLYQYTTSFCDMKENQDEYKFLGYEAKIDEVLPRREIASITEAAELFSQLLISSCEKSNMKHELRKSDDIIDFEGLKETKQDVYNFLNYIKMVYVRGDFFDDFETMRKIFGFFVQTSLEKTVLKLVKKHNMKNVLLSGGCFMNVKLNKAILDNIEGSLCVNPLSGDQGAAIGMFRKYSNQGFNFSDLCFGIREIKRPSDTHEAKLFSKGVVFVEDNDEFVMTVEQAISNNFIVNVFQGHMEFGPRALCNTSTLALPTRENAMYINKLNKRNEVMPMAPVILPNSGLLCEKQVARVIGSNRFMAITHDFIGEDVEPYLGVLHNNVLKDGFTCRPQIVTDEESNIFKILSKTKTKCLINTSFNTHGNPILFSLSQVLKDFEKQQKEDTDERLLLVVLVNKNK